MKKVLVIGFVFYLLNCGAPFSPRSNCYERNKCSTIEGQCFLQNDVFYKGVTSSLSYSSQDFAILMGTCIGLERKCRDNCQSGTIF